MLPTLLEYLYYGLKALGLFDKLLVIHHTHEVNDAIQKINSMSDTDVVDGLRKYERD